MSLETLEGLTSGPYFTSLAARRPRLCHITRDALEQSFVLIWMQSDAPI